MAYKGTNSGSLGELLYSDASDYTLSAAATETAYTKTITSPDLQVGDALKIVTFGTTAGNANAKAIEIEINSSTAISITNTTTTNPNGLPYVVELSLVIQSSTKANYRGIIKFNGVADQVIVAQGTINLLGSIQVNISVTGGAASDVIARGVEVYAFRKDS